jgi:multisubunit Na+/H+ antiporter MnhE subunit
MTVLIHILVALSSVAFTTYLFFSPTQKKFYVSYGLIAATLISGTILVLGTHSNILRTCLTGLFYLGAVSFGIMLAHQKYAKDLLHNKD